MQYDASGGKITKRAWQSFAVAYGSARDIDAAVEADRVSTCWIRIASLDKRPHIRPDHHADGAAVHLWKVSTKLLHDNKIR